MSDSGLHVVFGAGQIGPLVAERLAAAGHPVRIVRRTPAPVAVPGVEALHGDAADPAFAAEATRGATAIYHCINTPYSAKVWEATLPRIQASLVAAAGRAGAKLVVLDNLYAYGRPDRPIDEESPQAPCSRKGELRARLHDELVAAAQRGDARVAVGRASDFFGPGAWSGSFLGERFWPAALAGKKVQLPLSNLDTPHTYHFTRDVAAGLAALGVDPAADGLFMLPCAPAVTTRELVRRLGVALGRPIAVGRVPRLALSALGLVVPILRELGEMAYQWEVPYVVDDARFRARFGDLATPLDEAARATVEFARGALRTKAA